MVGQRARFVHVSYTNNEAAQMHCARKQCGIYHLQRNASALSNTDIALHLLPVNAWRLWEITRLRNSVAEATATDDSKLFNALVPFAKKMKLSSSEILIRKGDPSDELYLLLVGTLWVEEAEVELVPGSIVGEMGVLSSTHRRTATVKTTCDCVLSCVSAGDFQRMYFADPSLGLALIRLIIDRLTRDAQVSRLEAAAA